MKLRNTTREAKWVLLIFGSTFWLALSVCAALGTYDVLDGLNGTFGSLLFGTLVVTGIIFTNRFAAVVAVIGGVVLAGAVMSTNVPTHVRALINQDRCGPRHADACFETGRYYDQTTTIAGGSIDAKRFYALACDYGDKRGCKKPKRSMVEIFRQTPQSRDMLILSCGYGDERFAKRACRMGDSTACDVQDLDGSGKPTLQSCLTIMDRGFHPDRLFACDQIDSLCFANDDRQCRVAKLRCHQTRDAIPY